MLRLEEGGGGGGGGLSQGHYACWVSSMTTGQMANRWMTARWSDVVLFGHASAKFMGVVQYKDARDK